MSVDLMMQGFEATSVIAPAPARAFASWECPSWVNWLGIDPGQQGYLAGLPADGYDRVWSTPIPTFETGKGKTGKKRDYDLPVIWRIVLAIPKSVRVVLEAQQPYKAQGVTSTFNTGQGFMLWKAMLTAAGISYVLVPPQTWKPKMDIKATSEEKSNGQSAATKAAKARAITSSHAMFPGFDLHDDRKTARSVTPCADKAEAALLAEYGRRHL